MNEFQTHLAVVNYVLLQYPGARMHTDMSGVHLGRAQAGKSKALNPQPGFPDFIIYEPRGSYCGLALELKRPGENVYKRDGNLRKSEHLEKQFDWLQALGYCGFRATFAAGFDQAKELIDKYMNTPRR